MLVLLFKHCWTVLFSGKVACNYCDSNNDSDSNGS